MTTTRRGACVALAATAGFATKAGAADRGLAVGQIGPFTGLPAPDATQLNEGIKAAFAEVNARGGVAGRTIDFFQIDDTYTGDGFVKAFAEAMRRKPLALLSPVGSVAIKRMLDDKLLDSGNVVVLNAIPGAEALRNPGHPRLFHVRAGDRQQIDKIVDHARGLGITRLAVLHQNIPMGNSGLDVARDAAKRAGGIEIFAAEASPDLVSLSAAAAKLVALNPQAALTVGAPRFMADAVTELRKSGLRQFIFALSYVPAGLLQKVAGPGARGVALAQTYPNPMGATLPLQRGFHAAMKLSSPRTEIYTSFHLEGFITARVFTEGVRRAREISAAGLAASLRAMAELDLGGFRVDFSQSNVGSRYVDIGVVNGAGRLIY